MSVGAAAPVAKGGLDAAGGDGATVRGLSGAWPRGGRGGGGASPKPTRRCQRARLPLPLTNADAQRQRSHERQPQITGLLSEIPAKCIRTPIYCTEISLNEILAQMCLMWPTS